MMNVLLVSMPFGALDRPALGISLLKRELCEQGIQCDLNYLLADFATTIGIENYRWLTDEVPYTSFAGDWCFTLPLYGRQRESDWQYVKSILHDTWRMSRRDITRLVHIREQTPSYIDRCLRRIDWKRYQMVGFTSTFVQNIASLALAQAIKQRFPHLAIVFGGANWEDKMGQALFTQFPFVDYVCQGEADQSFPELVQALESGRTRLSTLPGVLWRDNRGAIGNTAKAKPVEDLNTLPVPDFADYYTMLGQHPALSQVNPMLLMETSRGCWWGAKHHCTFCGLNGNGMKFRVKRADRAFDELKELIQRSDVCFVSMVDNILDMDYFDQFLPKLTALPRPVALFYEVKANLSRAQIRTLAKSGVHSIQPGIESLSDHILKLMNKGTTGLRNVQLLKWAKEYGVHVDWNLLYGFPGERDADYEQILRLMPLIEHLQPPSGFGPIRLDRFSPYFNTPKKYGIDNLRPLSVFKYLYPQANDKLSDIAYYFDFDYLPGYEPSHLSEQVIKYAQEWSQATFTGALHVRDNGTQLVISDSRPKINGGEFRLSQFDRLAYLFCDRVATVQHVQNTLARWCPEQKFRHVDIRRSLDSMVAAGIMISDGQHYLALGVYEDFPTEFENPNHPNPCFAQPSSPSRAISVKVSN